MTRSILAALILALGTTAASAQTSGQTPPPLIEWDLTEMTPESQAACGAALSKLGYSLAQSKKVRTEKNYRGRVTEMVFRGFTLNLLSKRNDPSLTDMAWEANFEPISGDAGTMALTCTSLADRALKEKLIPQDLIELAKELTVQVMLGDI